MITMKISGSFKALFLSIFLSASIAAAPGQRAYAQAGVSAATLAATSSAASAATALAQDPEAAPDQHYVYCISSGIGPVVYFSDIFAAVPTSPIAGPHAGRNGFPEFSAPFVAFLEKKYGYKENSSAPAMCRAIFSPNAAGLHAAQTTRQAAEDLARQNKMQVVETGWKQ
jgi:hypothetical protein